MRIAVNGTNTGTNQAFIGIDPGKSGAIAVFRPRVGRLDIFDMPTLDVVRNGKTKTELSASMLANQLSDFQHLQPIPKVVMERVGAMPGQGVTSMFAFGRSVGIVEGVLAAYCYPVTIVPPKLWQSACQMRDGKDGARARAMELFPAYASLFKLKKHDGRADAALMAWYGATVLDRSGSPA